MLVIAWVAHDGHGLVDKLAIIIQRCCAFFVQQNVWFFTGAKFFCLACKRCKYLRKCKWSWKQTILLE